MRDMDKSNRGYLTNDKVYNVMQAQLEVQKQLFKTRRIMFVLLALVVILALANLGTSFAAASLAKDTTNNKNEELSNKQTGEALSTQSTNDDIEMHRTNSIGEDGRRKLCSKADGDRACETDSFLSIDWRTCRRMVKHCKRGNNVSLGRTWPNGETTRFNVCPYTGTISKWRRSTLMNNMGKKFEFEQIEGGHCRLGGNALTQEEDGICLMDNDCNSGLECVNDEVDIESCQSMCRRRRYAQRMVDACVAGCDITTCEVKGEL
mmetsp:Transcript_2756/g.4269  ORF Transcript_2756/g.4269 Transcript_2756/m.4269 type:complete len:263 (-) Transcript_2756:30-818(-)